MRLTLDLHARRGRFELRVDEELELEGITSLFGPSGAGKTTLLQALAGFLPGTGRIEADGVVWQDGRHFLPAHRRPVGVVFQDGRLFEHLDVAGNLDYAARRADPRGPSVRRGEVIAALGLAGLLDRRVDTLSGGETQRVAIGRALLARPRLLLMDEPLVALDRERKATILAMIADLPRRFGLPVLFVSHLVEEIAQIADRLVALRDGRTAGQGPTVPMLERLGADVTGHFEAGSLLEGHVTRHDEEYSLTGVDVGAGLLWTPGAMHAGVGERVRVRLRARDVAVSLRRMEGVSIRNQLPARIAEIREEPGAYAEVRLDCGGAMVRARITRLAVRELGLKPGLAVYALVKTVAFDRRLEI
ncbi:molybdenum ABC transporter ATP-binding protein [Lentisalinibacter sediminis]|uniref:molybdenum ABC transporter ATP-binding protein n=1 Tax=Lentisalinibacter sediminis TaxID=2992237 RepID=UPI003864DC56